MQKGIKSFKIVIMLFLLITYLIFSSEYFKEFNDLIQLLFFCLFMGSVALVTQILANRIQNPIKASALIGIILGLTIHLNIKPQMFNLSIFTVGFGATFIGMTNIRILKPIKVFITGFCYGLWAIIVLPYTNFLGGAMGTLACISCLFSINLFKIIQWKKVI